MIPTRDVLILCVVAVISCFTAFAIRTSTNTANISAVVDFIQDDAFAFDSVHAISIQKNGKTISQLIGASLSGVISEIFPKTI